MEIGGGVGGWVKREGVGYKVYREVEIIDFMY